MSAATGPETRPMTQLSDTQRVVLSNAARDPEGRIALPERLRGGAADAVLSKLATLGLIERRGDAVVPMRGGADVGGRTPYHISSAGLDAIGVAVTECGPDGTVAGGAECKAKPVDEATRPSRPKQRSGPRRTTLTDTGSATVPASNSGTPCDPSQKPSPPERLRRAASTVAQEASPRTATAAALSEATASDTKRDRSTSIASSRLRVGTKGALVVALISRPDGASLSDLVAATGWLPHTTRAALTGLRKRGVAIERRRSADGRSVYLIGA